MTRRTLVLWVLGAVVVSSVATLIANQAIRSPAEVAARTAPPAPAPILVPVVEQVLATKVVTRGTGRFDAPRKLSVVQSGFKQGLPRVITSLPSVGSRVEEGDVLLTISGRPVFVLEGAQPAYRDLGPGISGEDVRQLERALDRSGLDPGRVDGSYDAATGAAVEALYRRHGFQPVIATEGQLAGARPVLADLVAGTRADGGVQLPADEVMFVPATPVRVSEVPSAIGGAPSGPLVTVTSSDVVIEGSVRVEEVGLIEEGAEVQVDEADLGISARGTVQHIAERPGTNGVDNFHVYLQVAVEGDPPAALVGASVRLTIPIESTGEAMLTVPQSAVSLGPDGGLRVQRSSGDSLESIPVRTGLSASGYVSVTPLEGALAAGDLVLVGFERGGGAGGGG